MPGAKVIPCALCQTEAAAIYCVNDDAHLCASCDATTHSANPLLARHERRPLSALTCQAAECASAAHGGAVASAATDVDVAVVPQLGGSPESAAAPLPKVDPEPAAPLTLYEDSFFARSLTTSDLLDLDSDELELPGSSAPFSFDPLVDCVVPSFEDELRPAAAPVAARFPEQNAWVPQQPSYMPTYMRQQSSQLVPMGGAPYPAIKPAAMPKRRTPEEEAEEAARVARHRERQRKKRNFGRAVRYQSRRAYAEIRPRIKGRFVTPEEYAAYQAQQAGEKAAPEKGAMVPAAYAPPMAAAEPLPVEDDAVVPMPTFVA